MTYLTQSRAQTPSPPCAALGGEKTSFPNKIRQEYKLGRADAGWYKVRRALEAYGDTELTDFDPFKAAYNALSEKLRPKVFDLGFLPR
ncbi:hypothetical protein [Novosphingobium sp. Chol11]|uniref:hypothetical protein n=1 Tax=Novosphingobium sp. Chol11 TaxID=1385763 RepID=UPI0025E85ECA|nr:hypothetical protein [Novosphingobium sp. Chol11]